MKTEPVLICIPDISGFTRFMSDTDIELSSRVIPALLNKVIYANEIGLRVSEIEGDAVLFYKTGNLPSFQELVEQCKTFYIDFYNQLDTLKKQHQSQGKTKFPDVLGLKIILHYGKEVSSVPIGKNIKLMGEDVIIAHRLLKNSIGIEEYILISESLLEEYDKNEIEYNLSWGLLKEREASYQHIGEINYSYINLAPLLK